MIGVLNDSNDSLTGILGAEPATTNPYYSVLWDGEGGPAEAVGQLNGATAATLLSGVTGKPKKITGVSLYNGDTSPVAATLRKTISGTAYPRVSGTIPVGGVLNWTREGGLAILDAAATTPSAGVGAIVAGIGVTAAETGSGNFRKTVLTLTNTPITITDALAYAGLKLYDFPAGRIHVLDCLTSLAFTTTSAILTTLNGSSTVAYGVGSATASATTLATTMQNFMPGSGETPKEFTSSATINVAGTTVTGFLAAVAAAQLAAIKDGTSTAIDLFLNLAVPTGTDIDADATITVSGTIAITWLNSGDV